MPPRANNKARALRWEKHGAPGENRTPNLLVRSQALYPIELRAHPGRIVFLNYNGNRIISPKMISELRFRFTPNPALSMEIGALAKVKIKNLKIREKFPPPAKNLPATTFYQY